MLTCDQWSTPVISSLHPEATYISTFIDQQRLCIQTYGSCLTSRVRVGVSICADGFAESASLDAFWLLSGLRLARKLVSDTLFATTYQGIQSFLGRCILETESCSPSGDTNSDELHAPKAVCPEHVDLTNSYFKEIECITGPSETPNRQQHVIIAYIGIPQRIRLV